MTYLYIYDMGLCGYRKILNDEVECEVRLIIFQEQHILKCVIPLIPEPFANYDVFFLLLLMNNVSFFLSVYSYV